MDGHTEIKVFARLYSQKKEVGKLMVYQNNVIPKVNIVVVNVVTDGTPAQLSATYQWALKRRAFNQALMRAEVEVDTNFDINSLPDTAEVKDFKSNYINSPYSISAGKTARDFLKDIILLYEKFGKYAPADRQIDIEKYDTDSDKKTVMSYIV